MGNQTGHSAAGIFGMKDGQGRTQEIIHDNYKVNKGTGKGQGARGKGQGALIEDVFSISGRGTVVTGRIERGKVKVGEEVSIVGIKPTVKTTCTGVEMFRKLAYYFGRNRSVALVAGQSARLHSLPSYYGSYTALWFLFPAITLILLWAAFESPVLTHTLVSGLPSAMASAPEDKLGLFLNDVRNYVISDIQAILSFEFIVLNY